MPPTKSRSQTKPFIVIRKKRRGQSKSSHGSSAWKIAYADFVTAMMAFFLMLWLISTMSSEQKKGDSTYLEPLGTADATSGAGGVLGGKTVISDGAFQDVTATPEIGPPVGAKETVSEFEKEKSLTEEEQRNNFEKVEQKIQEALELTPEMKELSKNLLVDFTPEGLRIQLVDQYKKSMFPRGSARLELDAQKLLEVVAKSIADLPNKIHITGHTDSTQYSRNRSVYTNWELSTDRANSSRRFLEKFIPPGRIQEIVGKAETEPLLANEPDSPVNRRISILLPNLTPTAQGKSSRVFPKARDPGGDIP